MRRLFFQLRVIIQVPFTSDKFDVLSPFFNANASWSFQRIAFVSIYLWQCMHHILKQNRLDTYMLLPRKGFQMVPMLPDTSGTQPISQETLPFLFCLLAFLLPSPQRISPVLLHLCHDFLFEMPKVHFLLCQENYSWILFCLRLWSLHRIYAKREKEGVSSCLCK